MTAPDAGTGSVTTAPAARSDHTIANRVRLVVAQLLCGVGIIGVIVTILMTTLELLIQFLQAFLFALLAAMYIQSGLEADH